MSPLPWEWESPGLRTRAPGKALRVEFGEHLRRSLPCTDKAPYHARRALDLIKGPIGEDDRYILQVLINELVTNSVRHSGSSPDQGIDLVVRLGGSHIRAEVSDQGSGFAPSKPTEKTLSENGRGLLLVDRLADRWGVQTGRRTTVWFEVDSGP